MVYLDYASTYPYVVYTPATDGISCPNPNANYAYCQRANLQAYENRIKAAIGVKKGHILYFRTATDCIEWLYDAVMKKQPDARWGHSAYEHDCCLYGNTKYGNKDFWIQQLVNHITGDVWGLPSIRANLNWYNSESMPRMIVDATAAIGRVKIPECLEEVASALFMSGHKIGCPGLSFMWLNDDLFELLGGKNDIRNQWGLKHGSINPEEVWALTDAVEDVIMLCDDEYNQKMFKLFDYLSEKLDEADIDYYTMCHSPACTYAINAIRLYGVNADALQQYLATKGIYIGIGHSSCAGKEDYRVLVDGYGLSKQEASEVIRVSFDNGTHYDEIEQLVDAIKYYKEKFV